MSEGVGASRRGGGFSIGNPRDFVGGLFLIALALFALWASRDLPGMRGFAFGPGTAPRMFAYLLLALGVGIGAVGIFTRGPGVDRQTIQTTVLGVVLVTIFVVVSAYAGPVFGKSLPRGFDTVIAAVVVLLATALIAGVHPDRRPLYVIAAILIFAGSIRPLGMIIASFASIVVSAFATVEVRWKETVIWAAVLTAFCVLLFPILLNLPFQICGPLSPVCDAITGVFKSR